MKSNKGIILLLLTGGCLFTAASRAALTEIHFSGTVRAGTCVVETNSKNIEVNLGNVSKTVFTVPGSQSNAKAFSIKLTNCLAVNIADVKMGGTPDTLDPRFFAIQNTPGAASGVAVKVWEKNSGDIQIPGGGNVSHPLPGGATSIELEYYAAYIQTAATVSSGIANSYADFTIEYR